MKKTVLLLLMVGLGFTSVQSQSLTLGANAGIPLGDVNNFTSFQLGADVAYRVGVVGIVEAGPMLGYSHFFGSNSIDYQFLPVAASGRVNLTALRLGLDLGYALGLNEGNDGGVYLRPSVGFNFLMLGLVASYQAIDVNGVNFSSINLGVEFDL